MNVLEYRFKWTIKDNEIVWIDDSPELLRDWKILADTKSKEGYVPNIIVDEHEEIKGLAFIDEANEDYFI